MTTTAPPETLRLAVAGDREAFGRLYEDYRTPVFRFILRRVRDTPLAEDLTNEVFIKALRYIGKFEWQGTDFGAWLLSISRTRIVDHFRAAYTSREIIVDWGLQALSETPDSSVEGRPEEAATDHVVNREMIGALKNLRPMQRDVLVCRFLHDLSQLETADVLGITETQVKALQFRAVRAMARQFPEGRQR